MNKQAIITALLVLILPLSPWKGVRSEAAGQSQTKTATIIGYSPALKDGTVAESTVDNVRIANDTAKGGCFVIDAELIDMQGQKHRLAEVLGQPDRYVLLDFWSLGCGPCRMAEPEMRRAHELSQGKLAMVRVLSSSAT